MIHYMILLPRFNYYLNYEQLKPGILVVGHVHIRKTTNETSGEKQKYSIHKIFFTVYYTLKCSVQILQL